MFQVKVNFLHFLSYIQLFEIDFIFLVFGPLATENIVMAVSQMVGNLFPDTNVYSEDMSIYKLYFNLFNPKTKES